MDYDGRSKMRVLWQAGQPDGVEESLGVALAGNYLMTTSAILRSSP